MTADSTVTVTLTNTMTTILNAGIGSCTRTSTAEQDNSYCNILSGTQIRLVNGNGVSDTFTWYAEGLV